ncbi:MAG: SagB/ThcOx family dehydrogenase [Candidatus Cloacimonetes bacterium]|nr:SagB/ThcOx family dehydrogenase [Candidatus Cloacimonadota bacterium]
MKRILISILLIYVTLIIASETPEELLRRSDELYNQGEFLESARIIDQMIELGQESDLIYYYGACTWSLSGDKVKALDYLRKAVEAGWLDREAIESDADLDGIRQEDMYQEIIMLLDHKRELLNDSLPVNHEPLKTILLPDPQLKSKISVEEALQNRRSRRQYLDSALSLDEVSQILWSAYGITRPIKDGPEYLKGGLKTAPSAGALYPLELYIVSRNVEGLNPGIYKYDPENHSLLLLTEGDISNALAEACYDQEWVEEAAFNVVYSAIFSRTTDTYGPRGRERYVCMDLGHSAENIYLQCETLYLGTVAIGAFQDFKIKSLIGMTRDEEPLYLMPIGKRAD